MIVWIKTYHNHCHNHSCNRWMDGWISHLQLINLEIIISEQKTWWINDSFDQQVITIKMVIAITWLQFEFFFLQQN